MTRLLRYWVAALTMALLFFLLVGCGGGDEGTTNTSTKKASTSTTSTKKSSASAQEDQAKPEDLIGQVIVPTENSPDDFTKSINDRRPIAVTFYMLGPNDDARVRSSMNTLENRYKSAMDFYTYLQSDGESYKNLANLLNVNTTPTVVIINDQARVVEAWTGYADEKSLEQGIVEAIP